MITEPRKTGLLGEIYAARYLRKKGYKILSANYRTKSGEIDIIAEKNGTVCFVEVKTRSEGAYFSPYEAVDRKKEENVKSTAAAFLAQAKTGTDISIRFDIVEIVLSGGACAVRHIKNAF